MTSFFGFGHAIVPVVVADVVAAPPPPVVVETPLPPTPTVSVAVPKKAKKATPKATKPPRQPYSVFLSDDTIPPK